MIIVTGAAGFIGSNLVKSLNARGERDLLLVDDMTDGHKFVNLVDCAYLDYMDKDEFIDHIKADREFSQPVTAIFHEGACSSTTEWDGKYMLENNYSYSKTLLHYALKHKIPFLYASSAATYGDSSVFEEQPEHEKPLNVYGYSKLMFDNYVRRLLPTADSQIVGFRYFNVYGKHEQHKGSMASVVHHFKHQIEQHGVAKLFEGTDGYDHGEQRRDFIYVGDVVDVNLWFLDHSEQSGIFNLGTGQSQTFNDMANAVIAHLGKGRIEYVPFPDHLKGAYQSFTEANLTKLKATGCQHTFMSAMDGVGATLA